ncbi:hypothetical protein [Sphingopyxis fribergensis]
MVNPLTAADAFAADFRRAEFFLKRSGYRREHKEIAEADWDAVARTLGADFFREVVDAGLANTLIGSPPRRLLATMEWAPANPEPLTNVAQLIVNGVCRVRNSYIHGEKFVGGPEGQWDRDKTLLREAHAVLKAAMAKLTGSSCWPDM